MTPTVPMRASLAIGGMFIVTSSLLVSSPIASATPSSDAVSTINDRYSAFGGASSLLGAPTGEAVDVPGGAERDYAGGAIFYSKDTGAHVMYGAILDRYQALGGPSSELGFPKNDESDTGDGVGRFNDFSMPGGAAIYWSPQWGASVIKGRVLEAWRESGAITGPFGYPSADTSVVDGVQTGKFVGPEGTEIQWSEAGGLITIPAALAAKIPGFGTTSTAEGTTAVSTPGTSVSAEPATTKSSKWWWIPVGIAVAALLAGLMRLLTRRSPEQPVKVAAQRAPVVKPTPAPAPPVRPAPVAKAPAPAARPPAPPKPPTPPSVAPVTKVTPPPPPPRPVTPPPAPRPLLSEPPKATIHTETTEHDVSTVVRYEESAAAAETSVRVTYENNAVGDHQASVADKSDSIPD